VLLPVRAPLAHQVPLLVLVLRLARLARQPRRASVPLPELSASRLWQGS
jgi:hypothetical protein